MGGGFGGKAFRGQGSGKVVWGVPDWANGCVVVPVLPARVGVARVGEDNTMSQINELSRVCLKEGLVLTTVGRAGP